MQRRADAQAAAIASGQKELAQAQQAALDVARAAADTKVLRAQLGAKQAEHDALAQRYQSAAAAQAAQANSVSASGCLSSLWHDESPSH